MRFTRLELLNWDIQANQVVVLQPGVNLLTGENGSGKTSILDAIKVVLGGTRIGGDRSVEDYLASQAAPFAMIRLVADNRPEADARRRPFDAVQPSEEDLFTLAVVYEAQRRLAEVGRDHGVTVRLFHGRGWTIGRGARPTHRFLEALPPHTAGDLRLTEQGESIAQKYANRPPSRSSPSSTSTPTR
jgi:hypothetical protein